MLNFVSLVKMMKFVLNTMNVVLKSDKARLYPQAAGRTPGNGGAGDLSLKIDDFSRNMTISHWKTTIFD